MGLELHDCFENDQSLRLPHVGPTLLPQPLPLCIAAGGFGDFNFRWEESAGLGVWDRVPIIDFIPPVGAIQLVQLVGGETFAVIAAVSIERCAMQAVTDAALVEVGDGSGGHRESPWLRPRGGGC